ncbi:MAG: glutamine--fructose-6-phosphate transaminase (isomerizing) [Dehalococcoidia bacterium]
MCGIIGYAGLDNATPLLMEGLKSLEYRGYDSAGLAVCGSNGHISITRRAGRVELLGSALEMEPVTGNTGIAHTRWATHGEVNDTNAHPHAGANGGVAIVHNGIVENYLELREELAAQGSQFTSDTDSEVLAHLVAARIADGDTLTQAVASTAKRIRGAAAVVAMSISEPGTIVGMRLGNAGGIVIGFGDRANMLASDLIALLPHTNRVAYLESGEIVTVTASGVCFCTLDGTAVIKEPMITEKDFEAAKKGAFPHFMSKEIAEQSEAVTAAMRRRLDFNKATVELENFPINERDLANINRVVLTGMGTSLHSAMVGASQIETLARLPAVAENSSELRYREPVLDERTMVIAITQSGETADTLAAMELARDAGARLFTIVEAEGTQATRLAEYTLPIRAGQEIGVAATKTMTATMVVLLQLALYLGARRGSVSREAEHEAVRALSSLPSLVSHVLEQEDKVKAIAGHLTEFDHLLYLGRGAQYPVAMEGALKMKEVAYIHAEGYAAGEMKHGVNALISKSMPTIVTAPQGPLYEKMLSNINEVKARGGEVIAVATEGDRIMHELAHRVIEVPDVHRLLQPILTVVPMQQLAYHAAVALGLDPDKPRNLAKTVTVE